MFQIVPNCSKLFQIVPNCSKLALILLLFSFKIFGQDVAPHCENLNKFISSQSVIESHPLIHRVTEYQKVYLNPIREENIDLLFENLNLDKETSFKMVRENRSRLDNLEFYRTYQQYYQGLEVEGGGFTAALKTNTPDDPCAEIFFLSPNVLTGVNISLDPVTSNEDVRNILKTEHIVKQALIISHNLNADCEYNLAWRVECLKDGIPTKAWIDAQSGKILKEILIESPNINIDAETETHGTQTLVNFKSNGTTFLKSLDETIKVFDFGANCPADVLTKTEWKDSMIPKTDNTVWKDETTKAYYQSFYVVSQVKPLFPSLGINFKNINIANCLTNENTASFAFGGSSMDDCFISFGFLGGKSSALIDVAGHELAHVYLNQFIDYNAVNGNNSKALQEGLADIIGTYVESLFQKKIDWILGDDSPVHPDIYKRNLKDPEFNCITTPTTKQYHKKGLVLGYWFYLISEGNQKEEISSIGTKKAMDIILESLNLLGTKDATAKELMEATLTVTEKKYGRCSDEYLAVARAWELICVSTGQPQTNGKVSGCSVKVCGLDEVCEELGKINICACGILPSKAKPRWYILGPNSTGFKTTYGIKGNSQNGGDCLDIISMPKYTSYPQTITIDLFVPGLIGTNTLNYIASKKITIKDCKGDNPKNPCETLTKVQGGNNQLVFENKDYSKIEVDENTKFAKVKVLDMTGRLICQGVNLNEFASNGIFTSLYICVFSDETGKVLKTQKIVK